MKTIFALATALLMGSAYAVSDYNYGNNYGNGNGSVGMGTGQSDGSSYSTRHMLDFNADSSLFGMLSFGKSKARGTGTDNSTKLNLDLNYAYSLPMHPRLQLGVRALYVKDTNSAGNVENWGAQVGAIYNLSDDLTNSFYGSIYLGMLWNHEYGTSGAGNDEVRMSTIAIGKRFNLERWGIKHVTYTPEIALQNKNSSTKRSFDYTQDLQFRFLQFSVFF
jgi:hypothetical protein